MRSGKIDKYIILLLLVAFAAFFLSINGIARDKPNSYKNLSKGRTLGIGVPLPFPIGPYLTYWFGDTYGISGSGIWFGSLIQLKASLLYKFTDTPRWDFLLHGSFIYLKFVGLGPGIGVGLEYSLFRFLALTANTRIYLGLTPKIRLIPTIGGSIMFYF